MDTVAPIFIYTGIALVAIFVMQLVLLMVGMTGPEIPDVDAPDFDMDVDLDVDMDVDVAGSVDVPNADILSVFGLRGVSLLIWISAWLTGFTVAGFALGGILGTGFLVIAIAALVGFVFSRFTGRAMARFLPSVQTTAVSLKNARNLRGIITDGTARANRPARVLVKDHHGGQHYIMAEPLDPNQEFHQGEEVLLVLQHDEETGQRTRRLVKI